ncbi:putative phage virion morphogeneis protein [Neisseria sp. HMSC06F02]|nr:putative phage virion morphogeneis protein [Neisseria sp. HMSC06F02]
MQELEEFVAQIRHLALQLQPSARAKLLRTIATELRRRNRERIRANVEPDGKPMAKRQGDRFMFRRIRDGEGLNGRPFRFLGENYTGRIAYSRTENGNELVRFEGERKLLGFRREYLYLESPTISRMKMFRRLGAARWLRQKADANRAQIGWFGGSAAAIATVHEEGDSRKNLPARLLLGLPKEDLQYVIDQLLQALKID